MCTIADKLPNISPNLLDGILRLHLYMLQGDNNRVVPTIPIILYIQFCPKLLYNSTCPFTCISPSHRQHWVMFTVCIIINLNYVYLHTIFIVTYDLIYFLCLNNIINIRATELHFGKYGIYNFHKIGSVSLMRSGPFSGM